MNLLEPILDGRFVFDRNRSYLQHRLFTKINMNKKISRTFEKSLYTIVISKAFK